MVYSWDDKEAICYRLYVEERRSLEEVICYWEIRGFTPRYARTYIAQLHLYVAVYFSARVIQHLSALTCASSSADDASLANAPSKHSSR